MSLHAAAKSGDLSAIKRFAAKNPGIVNDLDEQGRPALYYAADRGSTELILSLVHLGADVNAPNRMGFTPLHRAIRSGHRDAALTLVRLGAKLDAKASNGLTPIDQCDESLARHLQEEASRRAVLEDAPTSPTAKSPRSSPRHHRSRGTPERPLRALTNRLLPSSSPSGSGSGSGASNEHRAGASTADRGRGKMTQRASTPILPSHVVSSASSLPRPSSPWRKRRILARSSIGSTSERGRSLYVQDNVAIQRVGGSNYILGKLSLDRGRLVDGTAGITLNWVPYGLIEALQSNEPDRACTELSSLTVRVLLDNVMSLERNFPQLGYSSVQLTVCRGPPIPNFVFHDGGAREFVVSLQEHLLLRKDPTNPNVFLTGSAADPLVRSLQSLHLTDEVAMAPKQSAEDKKAARKSQRRSQSVGKEKEGKKAGIREWGWSALQGFSQITKAARDVSTAVAATMAKPADGDGEDALSPQYPDSSANKSNKTTKSSSSTRIQAPADSPQVDLDGEKEDDRSARASVSTSVVESGGVFLVTDVEDWETMNPFGPSNAPISLEEWNSFFDARGVCLDENAVRRAVFYRGLCEETRKTAWKMLLGYHPWNSTHEERAQMTRDCKKSYEVMKSQWTSISEDQASRFSKFRHRQHRIVKDVLRTDRDQPLYKNESEEKMVDLETYRDIPGLAQLHDILMTYVFYNFDLGYCQGMSDFAAPILVVVEDEAEAFWCFARLMDRIETNFHHDQHGMHTQLVTLKGIIEDLDPEMMHVLVDKAADNLFFSFRWILIHFKREFPFHEILRLWETLWTDLLTPIFHLYVCTAILFKNRGFVMSEDMDFDTILKYINDLSGHIDLLAALFDAQHLFNLHVMVAGEERSQSRAHASTSMVNTSPPTSKSPAKPIAIPAGKDDAKTKSADSSSVGDNPGEVSNGRSEGSLCPTATAETDETGERNPHPAGTQDEVLAPERTEGPLRLAAGEDDKKRSVNMNVVESNKMRGSGGACAPTSMQVAETSVVARASGTQDMDNASD